MISETLHILNSEVESLAIDLKAKHEQLGMKATGDWLDSIEVINDGFSVSLWANDYTQYLVNGRADGKMPPIDPLIRWVSAKLGVSGSEGKSIAFAVAKKIEKEGTNYYPQGTDLIDGVITEQRMNDIIEKLELQVNLMISELVVRQVKQAFA